MVGWVWNEQSGWLSRKSCYYVRISDSLGILRSNSGKSDHWSEKSIPLQKQTWTSCNLFLPPIPVSLDKQVLPVATQLNSTIFDFPIDFTRALTVSWAICTIASREVWVCQVAHVLLHKWWHLRGMCGNVHQPVMTYYSQLEDAARGRG